MNREYRKSLIEKYLNAESSMAEDLMLAEWFSANEAEADEESVRKLIIAEFPEASYRIAEKEFDAIVSKTRRRSRSMKWAFGFAAGVAIVVSLGILFSDRRASDFNGLEIAQGIEQIISLDMDNVENITARPKGKDVIITALMKNGSTCTYLMSKDAGASAISITAMK